MLKQIRRFVPTITLAAMVLSCQGPEQPDEASSVGRDILSPVPAGLRFTSGPRPQASAADAGTILLGFEGFPSVTPFPTDA